jgi:hypothetical protein
LKKKLKIEKELLSLFTSPVKKASSLTAPTTIVPLRDTTNTTSSSIQINVAPQAKKIPKPRFIRMDALIPDDKENSSRSGTIQFASTTINVNLHHQENMLKRKFDSITDIQTQTGACPQRIKIRRVQNGQISNRPQKSTLLYQF